ncbi:MAG: patatin-like phospholipase family protein [Thermomonas sp.]
MRRDAGTWAAMAMAVAGLLGMATPAIAATPVSADPDCVGVVLGGGGARGIAHIGVLKVLERERIPVCAVSGTSMGAIVGGLYATGYDAAELEKIVGSIDWADMFVDDPSRPDLPMERKEEDFRHLLDLEIGYRDGRLGFPVGLVRGQKLMLLLRRLTLSTWRDKDFDALPIPFRAVAADIVTGNKVVFDDGDLAVAIRASMSVPGAFAPLKIDGRLLVDGGMAENVPIDEMRAMGLRRMVVVDVGSKLLGEKDLTNPAVILDQMITALMTEKTERSLASLGADDVLIRPDLGDITSGQFNRTAEAVAVGERAAEAMLPQLRRYAVSPERHAALRARQHRRDFDPGLIALLQVEPGHTPSATRHVAWATESLVGQRFDVDKVEHAVNRAYGDGRFEQIGYRLVERDGQTGLEITPDQKPWTAFGRIGMQLDDNFNGRNNYLLSAELTFNDVNRFGGKWRNLVQLGRVTGLRSEFTQPFGAAGAFYLKPSMEIRGDSLPFVFDGNAQLAEYRLVRRQLDIEAGYSPWPQWRIGVAAIGGKDRARRIVGDPDSFLGGAQSFAGLRVNATWDTLDSISFPTKGVRANLELLSLQPWAGTTLDGEVVRLSADWAHSWDRYHLLLGTRLASALDDDSFFQAQTFMGGFLNLSGYGERSLVGNQAAFGRAVLYRRVGDTTRIFSMPMFVGGSLEAGDVWDDRDAVDFGSLVFGGSLFVGFDTPLGPLFLGYGRNDATADSWYLTFGSLLRQDPR